MLRIVVVGRHYWSGLLRKRISLFGCGEQQGVGGWGGSHSACPQRLHLNNRPAAQGLSVAPSAGLSRVTVLHHYCTMLCLSAIIFFFTTELEDSRAPEILSTAFSNVSTLFSLLSPLVIHTTALRAGPLISLQRFFVINQNC